MIVRVPLSGRCGTLRPRVCRVYRGLWPAVKRNKANVVPGMSRAALDALSHPNCDPEPLNRLAHGVAQRGTCRNIKLGLDSVRVGRLVLLGFEVNRKRRDGTVKDGEGDAWHDQIQRAIRRA